MNNTHQKLDLSEVEVKIPYYIIRGITDRYKKPKSYYNQATLDTVNAGQPFYVGSVKFGYCGMIKPIKETLINKERFINKINLHAVCQSTICQGIKYKNSSDKTKDKIEEIFLKDEGVIHQEYNDRLAFLDEWSAIHYSKTGKVKIINNFTSN